MQDLISSVKQASAAFKQKIEAGKLEGKKEQIFTSEQEIIDFFKPYFSKQNECTELNFFINIVLADMQYGFIGGDIF